MRITVTLAGKPHSGTDCGKYVSVPALCPICGQKWEVRDSAGVTRAFAGPGSLSLARREVAAEFGGPTSAQAPPTTECRVRMPTHTERHDGWDGPAECCRCRQVVGAVSIWVDTLFGVEEDRAVLDLAHARSWRVY